MNKMKKFICVQLLSIVSACLGIGHVCADDFGKQITLMTYNIKGHEIFNSRQVDKITTVIKSESPDVVAIQEVDQRFVTDCAAQLGTKTGMKSRFLITHKTYYGIVLLSKEEPMGVKTHLIPKGAGGGTAKPDPDENRGLIIAEFPEYYFISTHYSLNADDRDMATDYIINFAKSVLKPVFVAGDLNVKETYRAMVTFKNNGFKILNDTKIPTYPSTQECIDFVLCHNKSEMSYSVVETGIADKTELDLGKLSDHLPLYVKINLSNATGNEQITSDKKKGEVLKSGDGYIVTGFEGTVNAVLYSTTGELLLNIDLRAGERIPYYKSVSDIVFLQLRNGNEVYSHKLLF